MAEFLTKSRARNIFYGGSIFFVVVFIGMTVQRSDALASHAVVVLRTDVSHGAVPAVFLDALLTALFAVHPTPGPPLPDGAANSPPDGAVPSPR